MSTKRYKNKAEKTTTKRCKTTKMRQVQRYSKLSNYSNKITGQQGRNTRRRRKIIQMKQKWPKINPEMLQRAAQWQKLNIEAQKDKNAQNGTQTDIKETE